MVRSLDGEEGGALSLSLGILRWLSITFGILVVECNAFRKVSREFSYRRRSTT